MADLTKVIPNETRSEQRFIQPSAPAPSFLEHLANFGSNVIGVADTAIHSIQASDAQKQRAGDLAAANVTAKTVWSINGPQQQGGQVVNTPTGDPGHDAAVSAVKAAAPAMLNTQAAGSQGAMDPGMVQARNVAAIRQLMGQFPGHEAAIATAARELGVQNMLTQQYQNAETSIEGDAKAQQDTLHKLDDLAVTKYGYSNFYTLPDDQKQVVRANVSLQEEAETALDAQVKKVGLLTSQQTLATSQNNEFKTQLSSQTAQRVNDLMGAAFTNLNKIMFNQLSDPALQKDPTRMEKLQSQLLSTALPAMDQLWATKMGPALLTMTEGDRSAATNMYNTYKQSLVSMLTGPTSVVEQNKRVMQELSDTYGISFAQAAPKMMMLQKIIGPNALGTLLDPTIMGNPALMKQVSDEMKGFINSSDPKAAVDFTTFVKTLSDDVDMKNLDPQHIAAMAPQQLTAMNSLARNQTASNGTDPDAHKALVKAIGNTSWIAAGANVGWGFKNLLTQGKSLTDDRVVRALFMTPQNKLDREDAAHAYVPAVTRTYEALSRSDAGDKYYDLKLDPHTLTWAPVRNKTPATSSEKYMLVDVLKPGFSQVTPPPSGAIVDQAATLNHMLHRLSDSARIGADPVLKGASYQEARKYYATGELPASMKQDTATKTKNGKTPEQNINDAVSHVLDFANKLQYTPQAPATPASGAVGEMVKTAAAKYGVPENIALRLVGRESSGNANVHDSDKGAAGIGQIMPKTAAAYGIEDVHKLSPAEQIDLSMHILADNYKKTGQWHDAVSMYHSGVDLKTAIKEGRTDGHMKTSDYVMSIVGATPDLDTSGAMPLGVETPYGIRI